MKIKRIIVAIVLVYIVLGVLGTFGVDVSAIVASLGLLGFAFGFALRDTIGNLIAGLLVRMYKHIKVGDRIKISGFTGYVESINPRNTILMEVVGKDTLEEVHHYIPNKMLFNTPVTILEKKNDETNS